MISSIWDFSRSTLFFVIAACIGAFALLINTVPFDTLMPFLQAARFTISVVIVAAYLPGLLPALRQPFDRVSQLILAIIVTWAAEAVIGLWGTVWRISDQAWMLDSPILALLVYCKVASGALFVTAPGAIDGRVPRKNWIMLAAASSIAMLIAGFVIGAQWGPEWMRRF